MTAADTVIAKLPDARKNGTGWSARCPAHEDRNASLSVTPADDRVLLHCHAGCRTEDVVAAVGLTVGDLFDEKRTTVQPRLVAAYNYTDAHGALLYRVARFDPKDFRPQVSDDNGRTWRNGYHGRSRVLYRLPDVLDAVADGRPVYVTEGEKDADALVAAGVCATTAPGGAEAWRHVADHARQVLAGADVIVVPDKDAAGKKYGRAVVGSLRDVVGSLHVREAAVGKDAADHLGAGRTVEQFVPVDLETELVHVDRADVEVLDPSKFFDPKTGLQHASLRLAVIDDGPIATGPGRTLWYWSDGVWLPGGDDEIRRRCRHLLGQRWRRSHVEGLVSDLAADDPLISDEQPAEWINCRNGLLDWATGTLHEHTPDVGSTYQLSVAWNPDATCPNVDAWLAQVVPDDCIDLVWEVIGTAIYADQPFHRVVLLLGPGRNGKGTLLRLIAALIGFRFISAVTLQQLGESRFAAASLFGKVANIAGDLDARAITRTDTFKMATGGDAIEAEHKYGHSFRFRNRATFLFSANEPPGTADHTDGFFARWVVIPFTRMRLAPGTEDPSIETRMHAELEGVLVRAVDGLRRAMARGGYDMPASVIAATTDYQSNSDPIRRFTAECLDVTGRHDCTETRRDVYDAYNTWCEDNGHKRMSTQKFWPRLAALDDRIDITRYTAGVRRVGGVLLGGGAHGAVLPSTYRTHGGKGDASAPSAPGDEF